MQERQVARCELQVKKQNAKYKMWVGNERNIKLSVYFSSCSWQCYLSP